MRRFIKLLTITTALFLFITGCDDNTKKDKIYYSGADRNITITAPDNSGTIATETIDIAGDTEETWDDLKLAVSFRHWEEEMPGTEPGMPPMLMPATDFTAQSETTANGCMVRPALSGTNIIINAEADLPIKAPQTTSSARNIFYHSYNGLTSSIHGNYQNTSGYCPLVLTNGTDTLYGWAYVTVTQSAQTLTIRDWACNMTPGKSIRAGQVD